LRSRGSHWLLKHPALPGLGRKIFRGQSLATVFGVRAHAKARRFSLSIVSESPLVLRAEIPEDAESGKANRFLLSGLERMLRCSVVMVAGQKSKRKTLAADCDAARLIDAIKNQKTGERHGKDIH